MVARSVALALLVAATAACSGDIGVSFRQSAAPSDGPTPSPSPLPTTAPHVTRTTATEAALTVTYDRPMKHGLACGSEGFAAGRANTIDGLETDITSRYYTSADPDFDEMLSQMWVASLNADCSAVTFKFVHGIGPGTYPLRIANVQDPAGRRLVPDPAIVMVTVLETAPPRMQLVQQWEDHARFEFSEPIKRELALDITHYRFDGAPLPAGSVAACRVATCAAVDITLPAPRGQPPGSVTVIGLQDLSGKPFAPGTETRAVDLMQGQ